MDLTVLNGWDRDGQHTSEILGKSWTGKGTAWVIIGEPLKMELVNFKDWLTGLTWILLTPQIGSILGAHSGTGNRAEEREGEEKWEGISINNTTYVAKYLIAFIVRAKCMFISLTGDQRQIRQIPHAGKTDFICLLDVRNQGRLQVPLGLVSRRSL